ncbi:MAG: hypothetical protein QXT02_03970 [Candidatus Hadarchaeum sp.]|uniref:hypothetical protein n=1 Tax=Candidatus Hadarchaeum sp. TaxID=2883567 RepID=UPI00317BE6C2
MERNGSSVVFLLGKVGIGFAAIAFIGFALAIGSAAGRLTDREDLELIAKTLTNTIEKIADFPGETECYRELPQVAKEVEVSITGELIDGLQMISVQLISVDKIERSLVLSSTVNNGNFHLSMRSPQGIIIRKSDVVELELVG